MTPLQTYYETLAASMIKKMEKRGFEAYYCPNSDAAVKKTLSLMDEGSTVTWGGSMTIMETGLVAALNPDCYHIIDRNLCATPEEKRDCYRRAFFADYYLMSANAVTAEGELVNVDGNGNRVAALAYGPNHVIVLVGMNKVEPDVPAAIARVHAKAAPPNALRLNLKTPCALTGTCTDCLSPDCICSHTVVTRHSQEKGRIKVILIGEKLGY